MKKLLLILGSLLVLIVVGLFVASFFLGSIVAKGVNRYAPEITGTPVTLESASISPFSGTGTLTGLFVGNPSGWKSDKAFSFSKIHLHVEPSSLLGDHIIIQELVIEAPEFVYETNLVSSNVKEILNNIEKGLGSGGKPAEQPVADDGKPLTFTVKNFRLENAKVTVGAGNSSFAAQMPALVLSDLGTDEKGLTANELATEVLAQILGNLTRAVAGSALNSGSASDAAKQAADNLKKLIGGEKKK